MERVLKRNYYLPPSQYQTAQIQPKYRLPARHVSVSFFRTPKSIFFISTKRAYVLLFRFLPVVINSLYIIIFIKKIQNSLKILNVLRICYSNIVLRDHCNLSRCCLDVLLVKCLNYSLEIIRSCKDLVAVLFLVEIISGPTALYISMIGLFFAGGILIFGGELGNFTRMIMMVVLVGSTLTGIASLVAKFLNSGCVLY